MFLIIFVYCFKCIFYRKKEKACSAIIFKSYSNIISISHKISHGVCENPCDFHLWRLPT